MTTNNTLVPATIDADALTADLRKLNPGRAKGSISKCKICGHEGSRNHKELNKEGTAHYWCEKNDAAALLSRLDAILAHKDALIAKDQKDGETKVRAYNAQREMVLDMLAKAKAEHAAYDPESASAEKASTIRLILNETLALLGGEEVSEGINTAALAAVVRDRVKAGVEAAKAQKTE